MVSGAGPGRTSACRRVWNGKVWDQASNFGPLPRFDYSMAYDIKRSRTVLFGGFQQALPVHLFQDTWEWDGHHWSQLQDIGPSARALGAMAYDPERLRMVLFAGSDDGDLPLGDTWELGENI